MLQTLKQVIEDKLVLEEKIIVEKLRNITMELINEKIIQSS